MVARRAAKEGLHPFSQGRIAPWSDFEGIQSSLKQHNRRVDSNRGLRASRGAMCATTRFIGSSGRCSSRKGVRRGTSTHIFPLHEPNAIPTSTAVFVALTFAHFFFDSKSHTDEYILCATNIILTGAGGNKRTGPLQGPKQSNSAKCNSITGASCRTWT